MRNDCTNCELPDSPIHVSSHHIRMVHQLRLKSRPTRLEIGSQLRLSYRYVTPTLESVV